MDWKTYSTVCTYCKMCIYPHLVHYAKKKGSPHILVPVHSHCKRMYDATKETG